MGRSQKTEKMAERQGFEPWNRLPDYTLSKRAPSAARTPLRAESSVTSG